MTTSIPRKVTAFKESGVDGPHMVRRGEVMAAVNAAKKYRLKDAPSFYTRKSRLKTAP